mgnify:CR=1 FL=1
MNDKRKHRAGVIVMKRYPSCFKILGLRIYGSFDLPKGGVDHGEDIFEAALRETQEECGITDLTFEWGYEACHARNVTLFLATTREDPVILPNPKTGEFEHHDAKWLTFDQAEQMLHSYLRTVIPWVRQKTGEA